MSVSNHFYEHTFSIALGVALGTAMVYAGKRVAEEAAAYLNPTPNAAVMVLQDRLDRLEDLLLRKAEQVQHHQRE